MQIYSNTELFNQYHSQYDLNSTTIHMPSNQRIDSQRELVVVSKSPAEVFGERVLGPVISKVASFTSRIWKHFENAAVGVSNNFDLASFHLLPIAFAQPIDIEEREPSPIEAVNTRLSEIQNWGTVQKICCTISQTLQVKFKRCREIDHLFDYILKNQQEINPLKINTPYFLSLKNLNGNNFLQHLIEDCSYSSIELTKKILRNQAPETVKSQWADLLQKSFDQECNQLIDLYSSLEDCASSWQTSNTLLHQESEHGNAEKIENLTDQMSCTPNSLGETPLHLALKNRHPDTTKELLKSCTVDLWTGTEPWCLPLILIPVLNDDAESLDLLLSYQKNQLDDEVHWHKTWGNTGTLLHFAVAKGSSNVFTYIFETQEDLTLTSLISATDKVQRSLVDLSAYLGRVKLLTLLRKRGCPLNKTRGTAGFAAIHWAALGCQKEVIKALARWKVDINQATRPTNAGPATAYTIVESSEKEKLNPFNNYEKKIIEIKACSKNISSIIKKLSEQQSHKEVLSPNYSEELPEYLVFWGAGNTLGYVGALEYLSNQTVLQEVEKIGGMSFGAVVAGLFSVGYSPYKIKLLIQQDINSLISTNKAQIDHVESANYFNMKRFIDLLFPSSQSCAHKTSPLFNSKILNTAIERMIYKKTKIPNCTFAELGRKKINHPEKFKDLYILVSSKGKLKKMEYQSEWSDVVIADAITSSVLIPNIFSSHTVHYKRGKEILPLKTFENPSPLESYPIDLFDASQYHTSTCWKSCVNRKTLGFYLCSTNTQFPTDKNCPPVFLRNIEKYFVCRNHQKEGFNLARVIKIQIDPNSNDKQVHNEGNQSAKNFLYPDHFLNTMEF